MSTFRAPSPSRRLASLAVAALATTAIAPILASSAQAAVSAPPVPYNDQFASGTITLCDESLHAVTSGSTSTRPFVWRAVSSGPAPATFNIENRRAYLMYFQPRQGVAPNLWTGYLMTAASAYDSTDHAIAQATKTIAIGTALAAPLPKVACRRRPNRAVKAKPEMGRIAISGMNVS